MIHLKDVKDFPLLIKTNQELQTDSYVIKNRGFITASKLKDYIKSPEYFFRKYILEQKVDGEEKACFKFGTAVDDYISYGEEAFKKKYFLDEGLLKGDLEKLAISKGIPLEAKETVASLKEKIYGDISSKIRLTEGEAKKINKVIAEFKRQKLFEYDGDYEVQKEFTAKYKSLDLKGTLDRYKESKVVDNLIKIWIRDTKTCADIIKFKFQAINELGYDLSMSFYNLLAMVQLKREHGKDVKIDATITLDACQTTGQFPSWFVKIPPELIDGKLNTNEEKGELGEIIKALDSLDAHLTVWEKKKDPNIWLIEQPLEITKDLDLYSKMDTTIQKTWDWLD
jgi:hypothetical protein